MATNQDPLVGQELLARYQKLLSDGFSHPQIAVECGYYSVTSGEGPRAGQVRSNTARLNVALLQAQGVPAEVTAPRRSPSGSTRTKSGTLYSVINNKGRCGISAAMVAKLGAEPGDAIDWTISDEGRLVGTVSKAAAAATRELVAA